MKQLTSVGKSTTDREGGGAPDLTPLDPPSPWETDGISCGKRGEELNCKRHRDTARGRSVALIVAALALLTFGSIACAQQWGPYTPPEGGDNWIAVEIDLRATDVNPDATGRVLLACSREGPFARVQARAEHLRQGRVYSAWLVHWDAEKNAVTRSMRCSHPDASLTADSYGWMTLAGDLPECPRGKYNVFVIRWNPDGDGQNTANMRSVLKGPIPNGGEAR